MYKGKFKITIINKIRETRAFTLSEMLVATIIMLLVSAIMVTGIPSAINAYDKVVMVSNAEVLLSTTMSALRNELCTASDVDADGDSITYYNQAFGTISKIGKASSNFGSEENPGTIMYQRYAQSESLKDIFTSEAEKKPVRLVSAEASDKDKGMYVTFDRVTYSDGIITFSNMVVHKKDKSETNVKMDNYQIRVITV